MKGYNLLWITLIILSMEYLRKADSFQCYECENCPVIGENDMKFLKECSIPPSHTTRAPITTTTTVASEEEEDPNEEEDTEEEEEVQVSSSTSTSSTSTTLLTSTSTPKPTPTDRPTSTSTSTSNSTSISSFTSTSTAVNSTSQNTTQGIEALSSESSAAQTSQSSVENATSQEQKKGDIWSLFPHSIEEEELINSRPENADLSEEVSSRRARQLPGTRPVCYVLKLKYDGFEVTNRGCGPAVADKNLTCKMLSKGQPWLECDICEGNLCNGAGRLKSLAIGILCVLGLIVLNSW